MSAFTMKEFSFTYPTKEKPALEGIDLTVEYGEFITICGKSGCGKSTLLRNLKSVLAPHGSTSGEILFYGRPLTEVGLKEQASRIGYVLQNSENQIVTDKVWHELAFGLESLGYDTKTIRIRVAEMASFFGIQTWFTKSVTELSGGQKQLLNLASIMAMQPDILILDEPTSQLDPIAATDFLETVKKINRELGTTVIMTEHRLEEVLPMSDRAVVLDQGKILLDDTPEKVGEELARLHHHMFLAMPTPMQIYAELVREEFSVADTIKFNKMGCPITVREGRNWLTRAFEEKTIKVVRLEKSNLSERALKDRGSNKDVSGCNDVKEKESKIDKAPIIKLHEVWFQYDRKGDPVIKDLSMEVKSGQIYCIVGGNGTGKTTTLTLISGINQPHRGKIIIKGKHLDQYDKKELFNGLFGVLPQNPQSLFVEKTVGLDLLEILHKKKNDQGQLLSKEEKQEKVSEIAKLVEIEDLLDMHPYDLSGGEQQRAALGKVLLLQPEILLLDEPTKGIDNYFKRKLAHILKKLSESGVTIVIVSHDIEFCSKYADQCAMFFDGNIVTTNTPNQFFSGNSFYTTAANRMSRHIFENAITTKDVIQLCKKNLSI